MSVFQAFLNGTASTTFDTPFTGVYHVKLRRIEYHFTAPITQEVLQITSNTLINQTPLSGRILFLNNAANNSGYDDFVIGRNIRIAGPLDLTLSNPNGAVPGNYLGLVVTLEFEKVDDLS